MFLDNFFAFFISQLIVISTMYVFDIQGWIHLCNNFQFIQIQGQVSKMTSVDSYAERHAKKRDNSEVRSKEKEVSKTNKQNWEGIVNQINLKATKIDVKELHQRISEMDMKITSLTNVVKLVQKYTETQDIQYEKQKENLLNLESILNGHISQQQRRTQKQEVRLYQIEEIYQKFKQQYEEMKRSTEMINPQSIRQNIESVVNKNKLISKSDVLSIKNQDLKELMEKRDEKIRLEINKKIEICMEQIQSIPSKIQVKRMLEDMEKKYQRSVWSNVADEVSINREIETIKNTLQTLITQKSVHKPILKKELDKNFKFLHIEEFNRFKEEVEIKLKHIVEKFSHVVKKYVGKSISPVRKISEKETNSAKETLRRTPNEIEKDVNENIHPNIQQRGRPKSKSKEKVPKKVTSEKPKSQSKSKSRRSKSLSKNSSESNLRMKQKRLCEKRREKQQQLREMIKKTKEHKEKLKGKKVRML